MGKHLAVRHPQPLLLPSQSSLPEFLMDLDGVWTANAEPGFLPPGEVLPLLPDSPQGVQSPCPLGSSQSLLLLGPCRAETSEASVQWWRMSDPALDLRVHSDGACSFILLFLCPFLNIYLFYSMRMSIFPHVCMCTMYVSGAQKDQHQKGGKMGFLVSTSKGLRSVA